LNKREEQLLSRGEGGTNERKEDLGEGYGKMSMVQIPCTYVCKWKMISVETIPRMGEGRDKGE
jgi:hypothetical protein